MPYCRPWVAKPRLIFASSADERGIWEKYGVKIVGVDIAAIEKTENREAFRQLMVDIGVGVAKSKIANSFLEGKEAAQDIGFPLVIRPSYTLGGKGAGFVHKKEEFDAALSRGLQASPNPRGFGGTGSFRLEGI